MSMQPIKRGLAAFALLGLTLPALADTSVKDAWVRASVPQIGRASHARRCDGHA